MNIQIQKKNLREQMLALRMEMSNTIKKKNYDQFICQSLLEIIKNNNLKIIHCFLPMKHEINIFPLIKTLLQNRKTVVTPKTLIKRQLQHLILSSLDELEKGVFGTVHPKGNNIYQGEYDLIIIPGLAFDESKNRLGYGGGYYDNFLIHHPNTLKIGIFYPFQKVDNLPIESHDVKLDEILVGRI